MDELDYIPNTSIEETKRSTDGKQVLSDGTEAPKCFVWVRCPHVYTTKTSKEACDGMERINAYLGPARCHGAARRSHPPTLMVPVKLD